MESTKLLSAMAVVFVHLLFGMGIVHKGLDALWITMYLCVALLYTTVYFLSLRHLRPGLRRRLRNAAVALAALISAFYFYNFAVGMSWWSAGAAWFGFTVAAYLLYDVIVMDPEEAVRVRLPV